MPSSLDRRNQGARQPLGRGRPSLGITKKVSLTLTEDEWAEIEASDLTVAAFLKNKMKEAAVAEATPLASANNSSDLVNYSRRYVEERWDLYLNNLRIEGEEFPPDDIIEIAKSSMFGIIYPKDVEHAVIRTHLQYECPFTGKRFGSMDKLIQTAIPHLIENKIAHKKHQSELATIRERQKATKYLMDMR